jgi:hypothetical protein
MAGKKKKPQVEEESGFSELIERFKARPFLFGGTVLVLILIIIAFVFLPTVPVLEEGRESPVLGYYNGKAITQNSYFINALEETARMANFDLRGDYNLNFTTASQVWYQAFSGTVIHTAILAEMKDAGYRAPAGEINRQVAANPAFQEDGRFSMVKYNNYGKARQLALWQSTEENYTTGKYYEDLMGLKTSAAETNFIGAMAFPERTFEMVSFFRSGYPDSELSAYALANPDLFKTVHLSQITISSEKEARQLLEMIQSGKTTFEDAARNHSTDMNKDKGGDMGRRMAYEIFTELQEGADRNAVTSLEEGEYSPVLKTPNDTWVFFRSEDTPSGADLLLPETLARIRSYMDRFEGGRMENWLIAFAEELIAEAKGRGLGLYDHVQSLKERETGRSAILENVNIQTFGPVSLNFGNMGGGQYERGYQLFPNTLDVQAHPELAGAASNEVFWRHAFYTPLNTPSPPFTLGSSIAVLTPIEETTEDETSAENIAGFYSWGWMFNALNSDMTAAFMNSSKFENRFYDVFMSMVNFSEE